ncbi:hypothetical protein IPM65_02525 [Candidatus Roizmanbacteria bacterium]|nr:MAG: hypothetical protein IPM65_02525 [Candidatus Roizmanbacteria bacterium]
MEYLQNEQHYIDRYDLNTIEECLNTVKMYQEVYKKSLTSKELKDLPEEEKLRNVNLMLHRTLFVIKGKRYEKKQETVHEWMEEDRLKQDKQDHTPVPEGIMCPLCNGQMHFNSTKHLDHTYDSALIRMMFLFKCNDCKNQQWVYDDGGIRVSNPDLCPKCKSELNIKATRKGKIITWKHKCKSCSYTKTEIDDFEKHDEEHKKWLEKQKKKEVEDNKLLKKYREEFCLTDKEGKEYVETLEAMEVGHEVYEEEKRKYDNQSYQIAMSLKKLTILELEELLSESLEKEKYVKFTLDKPDMGRFVTIPFSILDANSTRNPNISEAKLKKLIKDTLEDTNWRLMSDGVHYRLGYLSGTLKAYEQAEDLMELLGKQEKNPPESKIDPEQRAKYMSHNLVQLAKLSGEMDGIRETRKRRLEKEPDGFFLNDGGQGYTCGICFDAHDGEDIWWRLDGLRCRDCWRNIQEGVIPILNLDKRRWEKEFFTKNEITDKLGVHPSTIRKLRREGVLYGRDLKRENRSIYYTIYLNSENKRFLKKYPKKDKKTKKTISGKDSDLI